MHISQKIRLMKPYIFILLLYLIVPVTMSSQTLPVNLDIDEANHRVVLEGQSNSTFYNEDSLKSVYLEFEQADFWQMLHDCHDTENYVLGSLTYDGQLIDSIGARFKGQTSYSKIKDEEKLSFAISLNEYVDGQDIEGYNSLNFNNAHQDATFMKEVLYNKLNRNNIPGARANFIKLYINGEYWGIYDNVQQLNKDFTKEWFLTNNGSLWRADGPKEEALEKSVEEGPGGGGNWGDGTAALNYLGDSVSKYQEYYTLKSSEQEDAWELLVRLTDVLNNTPTENLLDSISPILNVDRTLWFLAHETVFADDDSYIHKGKMDYYIYYEPETGQFFPLEFDGNSALSARNATWDVFFNEEEINYPLMNRLYAVPEIRQRYLAHVRTLIKELLDPQYTGALIEKYDALIRQSVESDPKKLTTFTQYTRGLAQLKNFFSQRKTYLESDAEVAESGLDITNVKHRYEQVDFTAPAAGEAGNISARISGDKDIARVILYYCRGLIGVFEKTEMFDDGEHSDGLAGDGEYGASVPGFSSLEYVRYYVEARADDAVGTAVYSPEGAENDVYFYQVQFAESVQSDLVINEILASNTALVSDEAGEFDDWIELYNNSDESISLSGYYLSDDALDLQKWALPDSTMPGLSYFIVWADKDEEQGTNHAGFKLSADGEELYLTMPDGLIADQLVFEAQQTDRSLSRYPNGTGDFQSIDPTFNGENGALISFVDAENALSLNKLEVYPNPFTSFCTIEFSLEEFSMVSLKVYNALGQEVTSLLSEELPGGKHSVSWNANEGHGGLASENGLYLLRMIIKNESGVSSRNIKVFKLK